MANLLTIQSWKEGPDDSQDPGVPALEARGHYSPLLIAEVDQGGPGLLRLGLQGPVFTTDRGISHDYGWDWYEAFTVRGKELTLHTNPGDGAQIVFDTPEPKKWIHAFESNGLERRAQ